jgi:hypothetical protein
MTSAEIYDVAGRPGSADFTALLERAGFKIRGQRADCPYCTGTSRLTVWIGDETFFCHRCKKKGGLRSLLRQHGYAVPAQTPEHREAHRLAQAFAEWADGCERVLIDRHRFLWRRAGLARIAVAHFPDMPEAWDALADYYHAEAKLCGTLDALSFDKTPKCLEEPVTPETLFRSWLEGLSCEPLI